jgi:hypothetical protein
MLKSWFVEPGTEIFQSHNQKYILGVLLVLYR